MARLLVVDPSGNGLDFAMRAQRAGHDVRLGIRQTEKTRYIGRGLVQIVDYRDWVRWADIVFCTDNTKYTYDLDQRWNGTGAKIVGASVETAKWEIDRVRGMQVFKKAGVAVPPFREFTDYDKAIATYVKRARGSSLCFEAVAERSRTRRSATAPNHRLTWFTCYSAGSASTSTVPPSSSKSLFLGWRWQSGAGSVLRVSTSDGARILSSRS